MRTRRHNALIIVIAVFVTLFTTINFTITAHTSNLSPSQGQVTTGHNSVEATTTPMLLEPATIFSGSNSLSRVQALPAIEEEPIGASRARLQDNRSAFRASLAREHKRLEPMLNSIEQAPLRLRERYKRYQFEAHYRSTGEVREGHQDTPERSRPATTCTVTTPADNGAGSLRQCLVNAVLSDTINFDPQMFPPTTPLTITLLTLLPSIVTDSLTIDARNAGVVLDGSGLSEGAGFVVNGADRVTIQGLQILNFPWDGITLSGGATNAVIGGNEAGDGNLLSGNGDAGVWLESVGTTNNQILGNYIGTDASGTASRGNRDGIFIGFGAQNNVIGGETTNARNIISGNTEVGVLLQNEGTTGNQVLGNYIGTDLTGTASLGNFNGILIGFGAQNNVIGGASGGNLISGNTEAGISIQNSGTSGNQVLGNYIGTDVTGTARLSNANGIIISFGPQDNLVGGAGFARNVISGNTGFGIFIQGDETNSNQVQGNYIGTDVTGTASLGNNHGIFIGFGAQNNLIGGALKGNLISGNTYIGIQIQESGTISNTVQGNYIGTNLTGTAVLSNTFGVVILGSAQNNLIGGQSEEARNIISGNDVGMHIQDSGTSGNEVLGNYIGTDKNGTVSLGNDSGVLISNGAQNNIVGGAFKGNLISGNRVGIEIQDSGTISNTVQANYIGTDVTGTAPLSNTLGVLIVNGAQNNLVGGQVEGARNVISGNTEIGIKIQGEGTTGNQVLGNYIGTDASGTVSLGNRWGVGIGFAAQNNVIGGASGGNLISGNTEAGIQLQHEGTTGNQVLGNYIGTDASGTASLGNGWGVGIVSGVQENIIGGAGLARNLISGNTEAGIQLQHEGTTGNQVLGNYIGTDASGTASLGNRWGVFIWNGAQNNLIGGQVEGARNLISGNLEVGIWLQDEGTSGNQVQGNYIGTDAASNPLGNGLNGVYLKNGAASNTIGMSNTIAYNGEAGVLIDGETTLGNTITRNIIKNNGDAQIDFINVPEPLPLPPFISYSENVLSGSTCGLCRLEIYANPNTEPAGTMFLAEIMANAEGIFTATMTLPPDLLYLSATVTDLHGTTSEFSDGFCTTCTSPSAIVTTSVAAKVPNFPQNVLGIGLMAVILGMMVFWKSYRKFRN